LDGVLLGRVSLENVNWNMGVRKMTDSGGLSWLRFKSLFRD
jgi:hypothetical protein